MPQIPQPDLWTLGHGAKKEIQFDRDLYIKVGSFNFSVPRGFDSFGSVAFQSIVASLSSAKTAIMTAACIEEY